MAGRWCYRANIFPLGVLENAATCPALGTDLPALAKPLLGAFALRVILCRVNCQRGLIFPSRNPEAHSHL